MRLLLEPPVASTVRRLPPKARGHVLQALRALREDPSGAAGGLAVEQVCQEPAVRRLLVGRHRFGFVVAGGEVRVFHALPRTAASAWLDDDEPRHLGSSPLRP